YSTPTNFSFLDIPGATASSYTTPPTTLGYNGFMYRVNVSNSGGTAQSSPAILTVTAPTTSPTLTVGSATAPAGTSVLIPITLSPGATGVASMQFDLTLPAGIMPAAYSDGSLVTTNGKTSAQNVIGNIWRFVIYGGNDMTTPGSLVTVGLNIGNTA